MVHHQRLMSQSTPGSQTASLPPRILMRMSPWPTLSPSGVCTYGPMFGSKYGMAYATPPRPMAVLTALMVAWRMRHCS